MTVNNAHSQLYKIEKLIDRYDHEFDSRGTSPQRRQTAAENLIDLVRQRDQLKEQVNARRD